MSSVTRKKGARTPTNEQNQLDYSSRMRFIIFIGLLLFALQAVGQGEKTKVEIVIDKILGSWKFESAKIKGEAGKLNIWGIDTVEFSDGTLTFYSREISGDQILGYEKLTGTWELKSNRKALVITIQDETVEMPFKFRGKDSIKITHPVKIDQDSSMAPHIKMRFTTADVTYKKIGRKSGKT
jgi:hypothetical protein